MQMIHFHPRYLASVRSGAKTRTTRFNDPAELGNAILRFQDEGHLPVDLEAVVTDTRSTTYAELTDDDARHEALEGADDLRNVLRWHYPTIDSDDPVQVVTFHVV